MNTPSLSASSPIKERPIDRVLSRLNGVKTSRTRSNSYTALCPVHRDSDNSLQVSEREDGSVGVFCFAGCTPRGDKHRLDRFLEAIDLKLSDLFPAGSRPTQELPANPDNVSVLDIVEQKGIHPHILGNMDVVDGYPYMGQRVVKIPYRDENGKIHPRYRLRLSLDKTKKRFIWGGSSSVQPIAYGLSYLHLAREKGYIILCEGETDVWTLLQHGFPALGLPGAEHTDKLRAHYLDGIETIYIVDEGDQGAPAFVKGVRQRLQDFEFMGTTRCVQLLAQYGVKDPNELNTQLFKEGSYREFPELFQVALDEAILLSDWTDPEDDDDAPQLVSAEFVMNLPPVKWLIGGIIPEAALAMLLGKENCGKSFLGVDWACSVATGQDWNGRKVEAGKVVYLASEGLHGYGKRLRAWLKQNGSELADSLIKNLHYVRGTIDLIDSSRRSQLLDLIQTVEQPRLIVIDTLAESMPGGDENSSKDMGLVLAAARMIRKKTGAAVLVVHHKPKSGEGSRGHSSLPGALDMRFEMSLEEDGTAITLSCTKARDIAKSDDMHFTLEKLYLSDEEYDSSCVLVPSQEVISQRDGLTERQRTMLQILQVLGRTTSKGWKDRCEEVGVGSRSFYTNAERLEQRKLVRKTDEGKGKHVYYELVAQETGGQEG